MFEVYVTYCENKPISESFLWTFHHNGGTFFEVRHQTWLVITLHFNLNFELCPPPGGQDSAWAPTGHRFIPHQTCAEDHTVQTASGGFISVSPEGRDGDTNPGKSSQPDARCSQESERRHDTEHDLRLWGEHPPQWTDYIAGKQATWSEGWVMWLGYDISSEYCS